MMTKVRGSRGFDALFSRVFDEPGLKDAVDNLHDGFSSPDVDPPYQALAVSSVAVHETLIAPVSIEHPVVASVTDKYPDSVATANPAVKKKLPFSQKDTATDIKQQGQAQGISRSESEGLSNVQTNGWTIERFDDRTGEISGGQTEGWNVEILDVRTEDLLIARTDVLSNEQTVEQLRVIDKPVSKDTVDRLSDSFSLPEAKLPSQTLIVTSVAVHETIAVPLANEQPTPIVLKSPDVKEKINVPQKNNIPDVKQQGTEQGISKQANWMPLTESQGRILVYLYEIGGGLTNVDIIARGLDIKSPTVRESLLVLVNDGYLYLLDKKRNSGSAANGFTYKMNNYLCSKYVARVRESGDLSQIQSSGLSVGRSLELPEGLSDELSHEFSNNLVEKKETTPAQSVLIGAVGAYWEEEGLEELQAQKWCSLFGVEPEQMRQQLEWARFDLEANKRREMLTKDVISWFYDHLRTTGGMFSRPVNYQSADELRAEAIRQQMESGMFAKAKIAEIEFANTLQSFLDDPKAPIYQELLRRVNSFALEQLKACGDRAADIELEALFKVQWSMTSKEPVTSTVSFALCGLGTPQLAPVAGVCGTPGKRISLVAGWNLVGYSGVSAQPVSQAITSILTFIESIWGWSNGRWQSYGPTRPVNSLNTFEPGMGYWINMKQAATWTLP